ncbi:MAG: nucleotidyltransferase family protein, partial [Gemmatimonadota bacterium]
PTVFPFRTWAALRDPELEAGARSVVDAEAGAGRVVDVPVDDPGVLHDIDTPEAYDRHADETP